MSRSKIAKAWDGSEAERRLIDYARDKDGNIHASKIRAYFGDVEGDGSKREDYRYPLGDIVNGRPQYDKEGLISAFVAAMGAHGHGKELDVARRVARIMQREFPDDLTDGMKEVLGIEKLLSSPDMRKMLIDQLRKDQTLVDDIQSDIRGEKKAIDDYVLHASRTDNPDAIELFNHITEEEREHLRELTEFLSTLGEKALDTGDVHVDAPLGRDEKQFESGGGYTVSTERINVSDSVSKSVVVPIRKVDQYQHKVYGVVLSPDEVDLQGDMISAEEIEKASDLYMERYQQVGFQHERIVDAYVVQNFIAYSDYMLGSELVKKGSWVMCIKVVDSGLWEKVLSGDISGLSIGGIGHRYSP